MSKFDNVISIFQKCQRKASGVAFVQESRYISINILRDIGGEKSNPASQALWINTWC